MKIFKISSKFLLDALVILLFLTFRVGNCAGQDKIRNGANGRVVLNFNRDWKFHLGDVPGASQTSIDDSHWESIGLPHSFSIPYFMSPDFYVGYGWYRKHFQLKSKNGTKKVFIDFEGVFQQAEVFVNGKRIGNHTGGYTGFNIDITDAWKAGDNVIAVKVNNIWQPGVAPRAGEHTFSGGIYRDVRLVVTDPVHIDWHGIFITTPDVSKKRASVNIQTELSNSSSNNEVIRLQTTILDPLGKKVLSMGKKQFLQANSNTDIRQYFSKVSFPKLWSPRHPYLYTGVTTVYIGRKKVDEQRQLFGIRTIRWAADSGFFLNGKHLYLRGANAHQDHAGWGDAVTNAGFYRDVKMIKEAGFNFIRGSHYPHDPAFVDACDKLGILFWSESNFWGIGGSDSTPEGYWNASAYPTIQADTLAFQVSMKQELREMLRIYRNHPSVIAWSVSNEPFFTSKHTTVPMRNLLKSLVALIHHDDPTRPAAVGGAQRPLDSLRIDRIGDVAGYNGDGSALAVFQNPGVPNIVSEYGSTTAERPGIYAPGWGDLAKDNGEEKYKWRSGQAIWCAFDHGSIAGEALGKMGIIDYFRLPKRSWYWYRNKYKGIPAPEWPKPGVPVALRLEADKTNSGTDGTDDVKLTVSVLDAKGNVISNSPDVDLTIIAGPGEFPTGPSIHFSSKSDIRILDGKAAIEYRSWYAGKSIVRATSRGLKPAIVTVQFSGFYPYRKGITPKTVPRPYTRFNNIQHNDHIQTFGINNPTSASSSATNHSSGFGADGNNNSWWCPDITDMHPWWILDPEKHLEISAINIDFPSERVHHYKIEYSDDMQNWRLLIDASGNQKNEKETVLKIDKVAAKAIRIVFDKNDEAGLAEVRISGKVLDHHL